MFKQLSCLILLLAIFSTTLQADVNTAIANQSHSQAFTGKILGNKVRMRLKPDLESAIIAQYNKNDLVLILEDAKDFWAVAAPKDFKAYVFRSYIIDNRIEADRVNVRISPNTEAPIAYRLQKGDLIEGKICDADNKWYEITPSQNMKFYIAKEYVDKVGDKNYITLMHGRKEEATRLLNSAYFITQAECKKPFDEMTPYQAIKQFEAIIAEYADFGEIVQQAKEGLSLLQDNYLQKKIAFLEKQAKITPTDKTNLFKDISELEKEENISLSKNESKPHEKFLRADTMKRWQPIEDALFQAWNTFHPDKKMGDFYNEQKANSIVLCGKVDIYKNNVKNLPGDYVLIRENRPLAFLYSTQVDLESHVGKSVKLSLSPRPNNNFGFPAYFVNSVESITPL